MKKLHKLSMIAGVSLAVCLCIAVAVFIRLSWCKVTFVCQEGCEHTVWQRKGEVADLTPVYEAHNYDEKEMVFRGVFLDEERLLYFFEEELSTSNKTYYLGGIYSSHLTSNACFKTSYGDIMMYFSATVTEEQYQELEQRFLAAYAKLGGDPESKLTFVIRSNYNYTWSSTEEFSDVADKMGVLAPLGQGAGGFVRVYLDEEVIFVVEVPVEETP